MIIYVSVREQGGVILIPEGMPKPGYIYTVNHSPDINLPGIYKIKTMNMNRNGRYEVSGISGKRINKDCL